MAPNYDDSMYQFAQDVIALEPDDFELGGIFANKPGYHNKRGNLPSSDYSVREFAADRKGPSGMAAAVDITSKKAQRGDYSVIDKYSKRLLAAGQSNDPRANGWREFFGQTDSDREVEGWDFAKNESSTSSDTSHNWHMHLSELREFIESRDNKMAMLSILKGETLQQFLDAGGKLIGDDTSNPPAAPETLSVDGQLGPKTITRWQQVMGTPVDGIISKPSELVKAVQRELNSKIGAGLSVDGDGIRQDNKAYLTVSALQKYLGTQQDGRMSSPVSEVVKAIQRRLNEGRF